MKRLILLINIGTPDEPTVPAVRRYLTEFLSDPKVLTMPAILRWLLVRLIIVPFRSPKSTEAYKKVWTERGSPLLFHSEDLAAEVQKLLPNDIVRIAMRYGGRSIKEALDDAKKKQFTEIVAVPLFPQYSEAATGSALEEVRHVVQKQNISLPIKVASDFYEQTGFIKAQSRLVLEAMSFFKPDHLLMSYHGLPESHVEATDPTKSHCLKSKSCCDSICPANRLCYRAQSYATSRSLAKELGFGSDQYSVSFQSRLGKQPWIKPFTDLIIQDLRKRGFKRLLVVCPSFVADCLETIEEIGIRCKEDWKAIGGEDLHLVSCVNGSPDFAKAVVELADAASPL